MWEPARLEFLCLCGNIGSERAKAWSWALCGVLWQYLQWDFTSPVGFIFPVSIMEKWALWRAWGVRSGVRYLRPFSHSSAVWVILHCVKKKKNWRGLERISKNITLRSAGPRHWEKNLARQQMCFIWLGHNPSYIPWRVWMGKVKSSNWISK